MITNPPLATALIMMLIASPAPASDQRASIPIEACRAWQGISKSSDARSARPEAPFIADVETWSSLWAAWRDQEPLPEIDFRRTIVLLGTVPGPNHARMEALGDAEGRVTTRVWGTRKGGPGFGYVLWAVPRSGLTSVDGRPIPDPDSRGTKAVPHAGGV